MRALAKELNFPTQRNPPSPICPIYVSAKMQPLQLLHADLITVPRSLSGSKYVLVFMNDYSWFVWIKPIGSKDSATCKKAYEDLLLYVSVSSVPHFELLVPGRTKEQGNSSQTRSERSTSAGRRTESSPEYTHEISGAIEHLIKNIEVDCLGTIVPSKSSSRRQYVSWGIQHCVLS